MSVLHGINLRQTNQRESARPDQVANASGGLVFEATPMTRFRRFLVTGTEAGSLHQGAEALTKENAGNLLKLIETDYKAVVDEIVAVSANGRAAKQEPALFALAAVAGSPNDAARRYALDALPKVARIGTHLFVFAGFIEQFRGWGRALRKAVANWYTDKDAHKLGFQVLKYQQRNGWSHRDLLRLAHPETSDPGLKAIFNRICNRSVGAEDLPRIFEGHGLAANAELSAATVARVVKDYNLSWEMLPTERLNEAVIWEALLDKGLPLGAMIRQLPRLTRLGLLNPLGAGSQLNRVVAHLTDKERLLAARIHPIQVLLALHTYRSGHSEKGSSTWQPVGQIVDALDEAFYASFGNVEPADKRTLIGIDVSGSMTWPSSCVCGTSLTARETAAALSLMVAKTEPAYHVHAFSTDFQALPVTPRMRLDDVVRTMGNLRAGATDCSLPMQYALDHNLEVDTFVVYTDNETNTGRMHPFQALQRYREKTGIRARLAVVAMVANRFSIADPSDAGMMDFAGFDSATPNLISAFSRGQV